MCLYIAHIRICCFCHRQDTVLISETLCDAARASGIFASCGTGPETERIVTDDQCWGCKDACVLRINETPPTQQRIRLK
ncbi:hypothetical protein SPI_06041 [Niveomyces insectorum RCEF 264]|uniref:Uncharacterized protein n=1 Tax=Niveomyces insectorum RCEF 264 TaxID=1081102 RepID=A0A167SQU1_9HYPO|nr:hypothetical protein SPI_06041 [Niveomyces insectorum RCEF 264]